MKKYKKLAMFGGTFSPIHNGHLLAIKAYVDVVKPDALYIVPTSTPPHKIREDAASDADRFEMIKLAIEDLHLNCEIILSDIELKRGGKSYTVDTVDAFLTFSDEVCFFCGTDMLLTVDTWHNHERLLNIASIAYIQREDDLRYDEALAKKATELSNKFGTHIVALPPVSKEISSSMIRNAIKKGESISEYVHPNVESYIFEKGLYR